MAALTDDEKSGIHQEFKELVNMTASQLEKFLQTDESKEVGFKGESGDDESKESIGHQSGTHIVAILHKKKADLEDDDYAHMRKVIGYIKRHSAQGPKEKDPHSRWALSLKNWGHDPYK
jgi:hypothetical protein